MTGRMPTHRSRQMKLPHLTHVRARLQRMLRPKSKLGRTTLWFAVLASIVEVIRLIRRSPNGTMLSGWSTFLAYVFFCCLLLLGLRWVRQRLMWRLRNRLIVTYVFIGVIPILLLVTMAGVAAYLFAGQFATYVATSDLQGQLRRLDAANAQLGSQFRSLAKGNLTPRAAAEIAAESDDEFAQRTISVWDDAHGIIIDPSHAVTKPLSEPASVRGDFSGLVVDDNRLHLRTVKHLDQGTRHITVISSVPITPELLSNSASRLGLVTLYPPDRAETTATPLKLAADGSSQPTSAAAPAKPRKQASKSSSSKNITLDFGDTGSKVSIAGENTGNQRQSVEAGQVPTPVNWLDFEFPFVTGFPTVEWESGKEGNGAILVQTRPSMLYQTLFSSMGKNAGIFLDVLTFVAIFFGVIELIALIIGVRLTRSVTKSVAELYGATQRINRGDLSHRIAVSSHDQMAALEDSFNSMMGSLARLIAEQKEKQRLESELAIAHEVQELLFPRDLSGLDRLEVHGVCRPARTVSGDYYDFIPLRHDKMVLAVGDISGKGISAALLMATVHAFVRAYTLDPEPALAAMPVGADVSHDRLPDENNGRPQLSPASMMATLNYQLYRSTPPEKYATMFLASYEAHAQVLTYSNAGHLPPLLIAANGEVTRLETSGTVVGLFDGVTYSESTVVMRPGDVFVGYSDGITEPENEFGEFGEQRLIDLVQQNRDQPLARISELVTTAVTDWIAGGEQPDDITLVLARAR